MHLLSPFNPRARAWLDGRRDIFSKVPVNPGKPLVWMHCASLGEFEQGRPVIEAIKKGYPDILVLISFFSPSGYNVRKNYAAADYVIYLPIDSAANARQFLDKVRPSLVLWVKYEYWFYYLHEINRRNIPLLLISGLFRANKPFFRWYGALHRRMLSFFTAIFVQNRQSLDLLESIGMHRNAVLSGDTRFDRVLQIASTFTPIPALAAFCNGHDVIVAGSTWEEDEEELVHYVNTRPNLRLVIAPHLIDEERLKEIEGRFNNCIRFSRINGAPGDQPNRVMIIDNIGMLSRIYWYASIAYVGGGFADDGLHNILEAAVYGKPVIFGPEHEDHFEALEMMDAGGAFSVDHALELEAIVDQLLGDEDQLMAAGNKARDYILSQQGATEKIINYIQLNRLLTN